MTGEKSDMFFYLVYSCKVNQIADTAYIVPFKQILSQLMTDLSDQAGLKIVILQNTMDV